MFEAGAVGLGKAPNNRNGSSNGDRSGGRKSVKVALNGVIVEKRRISFSFQKE